MIDVSFTISDGLITLFWVLIAIIQAAMGATISVSIIYEHYTGKLSPSWSTLDIIGMFFFGLMLVITAAGIVWWMMG